MIKAHGSMQVRSWIVDVQFGIPEFCVGVPNVQRGGTYSLSALDNEILFVLPVNPVTLQVDTNPGKHAAMVKFAPLGSYRCCIWSFRIVGLGLLDPERPTSFFASHMILKRMWSDIRDRLDARVRSGGSICSVQLAERFKPI